MGCHQGCRKLLRPCGPQRNVRCNDAIVTACLLRVGYENTGIVRFAQTVGEPADVEELGRATFLGRLIRRRKATQSPSADTARYFGTPRWINNVSRVHGSSQIPVPTRTGNIEEPDAF